MSGVSPAREPEGERRAGAPGRAPSGAVPGPAGLPGLVAVDHIGIAVLDLEAAIDTYERAFGARVLHREIVAPDGVEEALLAVGESYVQLLSPAGPDSSTARFLERRGEGLHHVGYRVLDCAVALADAVAAGMAAIDAAPRPGSRGTTVAFLHPRTAMGTLIELVEEARDAPGEAPAGTGASRARR